MGATVPILCFAEVALHPYLRLFSPILFAWAPIVPWYAALSWGTATLQARVLSRRRRPVKAWVRWSAAAYIAASGALLGITEVWIQVIGSFGAVRLPPWYFWIYSGISTFSCALLVAWGEAVALWGLGKLRATSTWIAAKVGLAIARWAALLCLGLYPYSLAGLPYSVCRYRIAAALIEQSLTAALTAWLLDRLYFSRAEPPG
jgi:hypothetical protein